MRALLRLWAMCVWLTVSSPLYWVMVALAVWLLWRYSLSPWTWAVTGGGTVALTLLASAFLESGRSLRERARLAQANLAVLSALGATFLCLWLVTCLLGLSLLEIGK